MALETAVGDINEPTFAELGGWISVLMPQYSVPGVAIGVIHEGKTYTAGFGITSVENPLPIDPDTLFQIGSISKTFTATLMMRLVEAGKVELKAPVRRYLPDFKLSDEEVAAKVRVIDLFTHRAGWQGDFFEETGISDDAVAKYITKMVELPQLTPLGAVWSYNNAAFAVAARIIEVVTGRTYEAVAKEWLFEPLGMTNAVFFARDAIIHRVAIGHQTSASETKVARPWALPRASNAVGGISAGVNDMLKYAAFHLGDGTTAAGIALLKPETLRFMHTPQVEGSNVTEATGIAWALPKAAGAQTVQHGGATNGYHAHFTLVPEHNFAVCVLTNGSRGAELHREAIKWALEKYLGLVEPELAHLTLTAEQLQEYTGRYQAVLADTVATVQDGQLLLQAYSNGGFPTRDTPPAHEPSPLMRFAFYETDKIIGLDAPYKAVKGEFLRDPVGVIAWLRISGRIAKPQNK